VHRSPSLFGCAGVATVHVLSSMAHEATSGREDKGCARLWREGTAVKVTECEWLWQSYVSKFPVLPEASRMR
jgi:hypothetical protein